MTTEFVTPVGRIVWGNPLRSQIKKDQNTKQPVMRDGKQVEQWAFGVAFPKADFDQLIMPFLQQEAATGYPNGTPPNFSWKIKDGDGVDNKGKLFSEREGWAGCYILTVSTESFCPQAYKNEGGAYRQIAPEEIKTGDYVAVSLMVKVNVPTVATHTPGLFINPRGIDFVAFGQEIVGVGAANPDELFGGATYALPPGASQTPLAPIASAAAPYAAPAAGPVPGAAPLVPAAAPIVAQPAPPVAAPALAAVQPQTATTGGVNVVNGGVPSAPTSPSNLPPPATGFVANAGQSPVTPPVAAVAPPVASTMPLPVGR